MNKFNYIFSFCEGKGERNQQLPNIKQLRFSFSVSLMRKSLLQNTIRIPQRQYTALHCTETHFLNEIFSYEPENIFFRTCCIILLKYKKITFSNEKIAVKDLWGFRKAFSAVVCSPGLLMCLLNQNSPNYFQSPHATTRGNGNLKEVFN